MSSNITNYVLTERILFNGNNIRWSFTSSKVQDNVIFASLLLFSEMLFLATIYRLVAFSPRFRSSRNDVSYMSRARVEQFENWTFRWRFQRAKSVEPGIPVRYEYRNYSTRVLVALASVLVFALHLGLFIAALPANSAIRMPASRMVSWDIQVPQTGKMVNYVTEPCLLSRFIEGTSVDSAGTWSQCVTSTQASAESSFTLSNALLALNIEAGYNTRVMALLQANNVLSKLEWTATLQINATNQAYAILLADSKRLREAVLTNFYLLEKETGIRVKRVAELEGFQVFFLDLRNVNLKRSSTQNNHNQAILTQAEAYIKAIITGTFEYSGRTNSRVTALNSLPPTDFEEDIVIGHYTGPLARPLGAAIIAAIAVVWFVVSFMSLRSPHDNSLELREVYKRYCADSILAGKNVVLSLQKSEDTNGTGHLGLSIPPESNELTEFRDGQNVG